MEQHQTLPAKKIESVLRKQTNWNNLWFYQKTVVLYRMTYVFTRRFLPAFGDRTVDQMVQAARSGINCHSPFRLRFICGSVTGRIPSNASLTCAFIPTMNSIKAMTFTNLFITTSYI